MSTSINRRNLLCGAAAGGVLAATGPVAEAASTGEEKPFRFCLNTSTIRGHDLSIEQEIDLAAAAGYDGIEPWVNKLAKYKADGGNLADLRKRIADHGLTVEGAIGFANWIVDDEAARKRGLERAKLDMSVVRAIGGSRIAAPPAGATREAGLDLFQAAERFGKLIDVGNAEGVAPQLELWGFSKNLSRIGELLLVASECGHADVGLLPDVYHIYKGGSDFAGLSLIPGRSMHLFHMNDYPLDPPRETIRDSDRVYPGDGKAPLTAILNTLKQNGFGGALSLELFNPVYWKEDPKLIAETGLAKMKSAVEKAFNKD